MNQIELYCDLAPDLSISRILTGLWQIADMERDGNQLNHNETAQSMIPYMKAGLTTFDMADHYGSSEIIAGILNKKFAQEHPVQLLTKWVPPPGPVKPEDVQAAVKKALSRLQTDQLDLLQFHAWNYADPSWLDGLFGLHELQQEGLIKHLGVTNFDAVHLKMVLDSSIKVVSNQVCFSMLDQRANGNMTSVCQKYGVKLLAFGTLAGGFLGEKWLGHTEPDQSDSLTWSQMKYLRFIKNAGGWKKFQSLLKSLKKVAQKHGVTISNIASRHILEHPAVGGIIIGARLGESEHIKENQKLFEFSLDRGDHEIIKKSLSSLNPISGDCGDEYRKPPYLTASGDLSHHLEEFPSPFSVTREANGTLKTFSGTSWEEMAGYCRAIRKGNQIFVSGTTATHGDKIIGGNDPTSQAHFAIDKIEGALLSLNAKLEDVVRTRIFVSNISDWELIARAHGQRFGKIQPANTLVQAKLVGEPYLVEIEADAVVLE